MLLSKSLKSLVLYSLAGSCALLVAGCDKQSSDKAQPQASPTPAIGEPIAAPAPAEAGSVDRSHKGEPMPTISLVDPTGESLDLTSLKGKPVLVNLWATWCAPCVKELPTLNALTDQEDKLGITVLPVSENSADVAGKVVEILRRRKLDNIQPWIDEQGDMGFQYGGNLPVSVLFDSEGKEVWRYTGANDWTSPAALKLIAEAK
ncbi:TlpA family protein disulfide reductase [Novosphingobium sp. 1949]|uniref:TlpA family protein disulfide reductase n=1 Tax=Novosphingobium organovorum TaxID=2930092 RepID=A0ABT0BIV5_9SPHN|nr:TlpA disulfide reductase family protein [Novosphingobium organovorum]MCJ2184898.1 TlpA family protein disulfide reductase [Novosphingobium organovorum]